MIIKSLALNEDLEEQIPKEMDAFPHFSCYVEMDRYLGKVIPWHWHPKLEFTYVLQGTMRLSTNNEGYVIGAGEGAFINSNMLHYQEPMPGLPVITLSQVVDPELIAGAHKSVFEQKYVTPILECQELEAVHFRPETPNQREILERLRRSYEAADRAEPGHEFTVRGELSRVWFLLWQETADRWSIKKVVNNQSEERIKKMLLFIQNHYKEKLSLDMIARAASISGRECLRCFSQNLNTTPFTYLLEYRIRRAASELQRSDRSVTEIAYACGFSGTSYFSKTFRKLMGCTPSEYRKGEEHKLTS